MGDFSGFNPIDLLFDTFFDKSHRCVNLDLISKPEQQKAEIKKSILMDTGIDFCCYAKSKLMEHY